MLSTTDVTILPLVAFPENRHFQAGAMTAPIYCKKIVFNQTYDFGVVIILRDTYEHVYFL